MTFTSSVNITVNVCPLNRIGTIFKMSEQINCTIMGGLFVFGGEVESDEFEFELNSAFVLCGYCFLPSGMLWFDE